METEAGTLTASPEICHSSKGIGELELEIRGLRRVSENSWQGTQHTQIQTNTPTHTYTQIHAHEHTLARKKKDLQNTLKSKLKYSSARNKNKPSSCYNYKGRREGNKLYILLLYYYIYILYDTINVYSLRHREL